VACGSRALHEGVDLLDQLPHRSPGQHVLALPGAVAVERHELDEADLEAALAGEVAEAQDVLATEAGHRHRVDLDRADRGEGGDRIEAGEHPVERVAAGDLEEAGAGEAVDRDVDAVDPGGDEVGGLVGEHVAVGGQREVVDTLDRREALDQRREFAPHQRLAAGQADGVDAETGEEADESLDLLEGEDFVTRDPVHPLGRHAVAAAEVAAVGDRHPQIADQPAVRVFEGHR
jgi:hypothetical protein